MSKFLDRIWDEALLAIARTANSIKDTWDEACTISCKIEPSKTSPTSDEPVKFEKKSFFGLFDYTERVL